ncbi:MAG: hypothetical protein A3H70_00775 [Candidatus Komeilibacteria bacterium RIFCSPLOWO2_02_FULL_48_11]|uniref:HEPN domain-containing protein n=1 Tax=Candidatus Komeilibacteria bacterium RIFCSPLOWO2_02_FULL_48_11 TaxID=1798553 RepID=A0A1G2BUH5_9BACT|nr:MAG: hypothetical protein A3H70_00775 [Candidatus Komeilibacteria bacterium RIFCSPLOWO2_02_FULL_48_11]
MKDSQAQANRWRKQAEYDLQQAERCSADNSFAYGCFFAEQAAQKFLKSYLIGQGQRFINIHSVGELLKEAGSLDKKFIALVPMGQKLDRYYLSSRYPDALPDPAIPAESYSRADANEALDIARQISNVIK